MSPVMGNFVSSFQEFFVSKTDLVNNYLDYIRIPRPWARSYRRNERRRQTNNVNGDNSDNSNATADDSIGNADAVVVTGGAAGGYTPLERWVLEPTQQGPYQAMKSVRYLAERNIELIISYDLETLSGTSSDAGATWGSHEN